LIPAAAPYRDPRQSAVRRALPGLRKKFDSVVRVTNITTGYPASNVDVQTIRTMLERALLFADPAWLRGQWPLVRKLIEETMMAWAQRVRWMKVTPYWRQHIILVEFLTEDDIHTPTRSTSNSADGDGTSGPIRTFVICSPVEAR